MAPLRHLVLMVVAIVLADPAQAAERLVRSQSEYQAAINVVRPGDTIRLANGIWKDFRILFEGQGTANRPITLTAETKGKAIIAGASDLRIAGKHLIVSGLVFRDGSAPGKELISLRRDSKNVASNVRLTEIVVNAFNKPDRRAEDIWVALYGQDNRVDHSWFAGKRNAGVTFAVIRPKGKPRPNRHRIDHNYFGPRPPLGANGGETIRIGTSEESLSSSSSIVERNYFEHCDGEVEIISIKSGGNIVRENTILESQGSIVLRHGNGNLVERNIILGNGKPHTGGIRVINRDQVVRDNYLEGLRGDDFTSALAVMSGVPNSAINRYHQVANARIERNSFIEVARLTFGAGADAERTAPPIDSSFSRNLITAQRNAFGLAADPSGIATVGNITSFAPPARLAGGVMQRPVRLTRAANGLLYAEGLDVGAPRDLKPVTKAEVGPRWYMPGTGNAALGSGRIIPVPAGSGKLGAAAASARAGDTLQLAAGEHRVASPILVDRPLTLSGNGTARVTFTAPTLFQLAESGSLELRNFAITGVAAPRTAGNAVIRSAPHSTIANYDVILERMELSGMDDAPGFDVLATTPSTKAERIEIRQSRFSDVSGTIIAAAAEAGKEGYYSAERILIADSRFANVGRIAHVARLGTDESTFGPLFTFAGNEVEGGGTPTILLSGVQATSIIGNRFRRAGSIDIAHSVGAPDTIVECNQLIDTPAPRTTNLYPLGKPNLRVAYNGAGEEVACAARS